MPKSALKSALLFCIVILVIACYKPGLAGHFIFDDGINIRINPFLKIDRLDIPSVWKAASWGGAKPLGRPISMATFAIDYHLFGMSPYYFKATNLAIHLLNGLLVFVLVRSLLSLHLRVREATDDCTASWVGVAVTMMWLLHPFNLTSVLYVVQRMTSLAALFTLAGLALYFVGRKKLLDGRRSGFIAIGASLLVCTPLAALCKESGVLLPLLILVCEATLLRWCVPDIAIRRLLSVTVGLAVVIPLLLGLYYLMKAPGQILGGYVWRDFSLLERLLTEARVLWFYLHMIVLPNPREMGLHHDDFLISRSLLSPWTTLPAIAGLLLLAIGGIAIRKKCPLITFGIAFFFAGHAMESTIIPLELVFEHRNYLSMLGVLVPLAYYAIAPRLHPLSTHLRRAAFVLLLVLFGGLTAARAHQWGNTFLMRSMEVERHPRSVRAQTDLANFYDYLPPTSQDDAIGLYRKARFHYQQAADNGPLSIAGLFGILAMNAHRGLPVEEPLLETIEQRLAMVPLGPPNMNTLIGAARDIADGHIPIAQEFVDRIFRAALSNPLLTDASRYQLISEFGNIPPQLRPKMEAQK